MYTHSSRDDRVIISDGLRRGESYQCIADRIGKDKGTVSREVCRNKDPDGTYDARRADRRARHRRQMSKQSSRLLENHQTLADTVEALLDPLVSPECIGYLLCIHHQSIYSWVYRSRPDLKERLPYRGKKRRRYGGKREKKQGWTSNVRPITERPESNLSWEGDTIKGGTRARVLTHVEQQSLFLVANVLADGTADSVHATLKKHQRITGISTYDRGSEFALWQMIERDTDSTIYFAEPHHPWQRGKNENTNGRLRRIYPKKCDFATVSIRDLEDTVDLMNHTPRKSLSWQTPAEVYEKVCCTSI